MKRLLLLLCLAAGIGCASDKGNSPFSDAMKDLRGDNMRMQSWPGAGDGLGSGTMTKGAN